MYFDQAAEIRLSTFLTDPPCPCLLICIVMKTLILSETTEVKSGRNAAFIIKLKASADLNCSLVISAIWSAACPYRWGFSTIPLSSEIISIALGEVRVLWNVFRFYASILYIFLLSFPVCRAKRLCIPWKKRAPWYGVCIGLQAHT